MKRPVIRRASIALALAGATALSVTSAAVQQRAAALAVPSCATAQLTVWMGIPGDGAAGTIFYELQFSNTSHLTCSLEGYPRIWAFRSGHRVGPVSVHDTMFGPSAVTLRPGATVHAVLGIAEAGNVCTNPVTADALQVYPPGTKRAALVGFSFGACTNQSVLHVRVVRRGAGIPGYSQ
jgi:Domain of unknown function (DUF4232)